MLGFGTDNYKWTAPEAAATAIVHSRLTFSSLGTQAAAYVLVVVAVAARFEGFFQIFAAGVSIRRYILLYFIVAILTFSFDLFCDKIWFLHPLFWW